MKPTTGGTPGRSRPLPPRQTWYLARRWIFVVLFVLFSAVMVVLGIVRWTDGSLEPGLRTVLAVGHAALSVLPAYLALSSATARLEADTDGLHLVRWPRTTTYRWDDIAEIRPSILKARRTPLVLVLHHGPTVDLPVTDEHLAELRRWHETAR